MEEKQQIILANQDGGTVTGGAPTFFVILKQPGNGKTDQGILVTNRDARALLSRSHHQENLKRKFAFRLIVLWEKSLLPLITIVCGMSSIIEAQR